MLGPRTRVGVLGALTAALTVLTTTPAMATGTTSTTTTTSTTAAESINPAVILPAGERPDVGEPWTNRYVEREVFTTPCGVYGRPTGADGGITVRHRTELFVGWDTALKFPTPEKADAAFRQYEADLITCEDRYPEDGDGSGYMKDVRQVGTADGVRVYRAISGVTGYPGTPYQFAVVRQGRVLYALTLMDHRSGENPPVEYEAAVKNIKTRIAAYYP
ncbi:hypothetical protein [Actinomadura sp. 6N118]|uniref:hypothetical protein n=1 Tax=Actinomadura sp. 6N118 TaxID=3375151 RepID=UPI0037BDC3D2